MKIHPSVLAAFAIFCFSPTSPAQEVLLYDVATPSLGATAKGSKAKFNRDWPAGRALQEQKGGTIFDPFEGATVDVRLVMPVEIQAVEITGLNYGNTRQVSGVDISIDDRKIAHAELPDDPGKPTRIEVPSTVGQFVRVVATGGHPNRVDKNGKTGPAWGGYAKISVLSPTNLTEKLKHVDTYEVPSSPAFVAPTTQSQEKPQVEVNGQPRIAQGHPRTLWDKEDITHFQAMLKTSASLAQEYNALKKSMDDLLTQPVSVPQPVKDDQGNWTHLPGKTHGRIHTELSLQISNLGTIYALSGEEKYADRAKKMLLAYAEAFPNYAPGNRPGFKHDQGRVFDQRLSDATWLIPVARGYDLIHNSPGLTAEDRKNIEANLLKASAEFIAANSSTMKAPTNWSAICTTAVLMTGHATDDQALIDLAMFGPKGTEENPTGGVMLHFSEKSINPDGLWAEGAIGYQFMAMQSLIANAEILWRNGRDMYRHRDGALKKLFDSPIAYSFPDLKTPSVHDSNSVDIVGHESYLYEYGYLRYRDPRYLLILNNPNVATRLDVRFQQFPISILYDRDRDEAIPPIEWLSENFNDVGYGILRNTSQNGTVSLLLDYGPNRSHGHPDKMNIDLWTSKTGRLIPDPGMVWYEQPLYRNWYRTSLAHNTLVVDEQDQIESDGSLLVYGFTDTMGIQRGHALEAAPGVTMDRSVFLTPEYLADIFGAFARLPRKLDLAWHIRGEFTSDLDLKAATLPEPREPGYSELVNVTSARTDKPWTATFKTAEIPIKLHAAPGSGTEVITGGGWYGRERPRTILQRRLAAATIFGNAVDLATTAEGVVKSTSLEGSLEKGYALLSVQTQRGEDICFASYRPGTYRAGGLETDALQAFVRREGTQTTGLFLGGGRFLKAGEAGLTLADPGLVALEKADTGTYILANLSPGKARITLDFPPVASMDVHVIDAKGKRTGSMTRSSTYALEGGQRLEFAAPGQASVHDTRMAMLRTRQEAQEAALKSEREAATARSQARDREATAKPAPANTLTTIQAEAFRAEEGGKTGLATNKIGHNGTSLSGWNSEGHWLEWEVDMPADGYYNISLCYATEPNNSLREININGEVQEPFAPFALPSTGGFSNSGDDWRLFTAGDPVTGKPLLVKFKQGKNIIRLTNTNGLAANLDYLVVSSPDVVPTREKATPLLTP